LEKVFDMGFCKKYLCGVFELPLPRNVQKRTLKKGQEKKVGWWVGGSGIQQMHGGVRRFYFWFLAAPRRRCATTYTQRVSNNANTGFACSNRLVR
jgi:hypothetical protein